MTTRVVVAGIVTVLCVACAGLGGQPDWADGTSRAYPKERYVLGVGEADDLDSARDRARAEIARRFVVSIEDEVRDASTGTTVSDRAHSESTLIERVDVTTISRTEGDFEGVEIAETWQDPKTARTWALAVLDKADAWPRFREEAAADEREVAGHVARADGARDPLAETKALVQAVRAAGRRDVALARARVVRPDGAAAPVSASGVTSTPALEDRLLGAASSVHFSVRADEIEPDSGSDRGALPTLRDEIASLLTGMGFEVHPEAAAPASVDCRVGLRRVERDDGWTHFRWSGACEVTRPGEVLVSASESGSESHPVSRTARTKALTKAERALVAAIDAALRDYLYASD